MGLVPRSTWPYSSWTDFSGVFTHQNLQGGLTYLSVKEVFTKEQGWVTEFPDLRNMPLAVNAVIGDKS